MSLLRIACVVSILVGCSGASSTDVTDMPDGASTVAEVDPPSETSIVDTRVDDVTPVVPTEAGPEVGVPADYAAKGPHPVTKRDTKLGGTSVHLVHPSDPSPAGGFPGIAFAHGFQLQIAAYDLLLEHLASWGYVVVSTDYPGTLFSIDHNDVAKALTVTRAAMAAGSIPGLPKVGKIAAAGHSLGGKGALMAALSDPLFVAVLGFDPVDGNPGNPLGGTPDAAHPKLTPTQTAKLAVPVGYFGATQSHCGSTACAPTGLDAAALYDATPASIPRYLWTVYDAGHMQFLDNPNCGFTCSACAAGKSPLDPRRAAIHATAVAFLRRHIDGVESASSWLDGAKLAEHVTAKLFWDGKIAKPGC